jgi:hypothetical protein
MSSNEQDLNACAMHRIRFPKEQPNPLPRTACGKDNPMNDWPAAYETTYTHYLEQIRRVDLEAVAPRIGAVRTGKALEIPILDQCYRVSADRITDTAGGRPGFDVCVILARYVLMAPAGPPAEEDWVSFKDFKDAGPLTAYFSNEIERGIAVWFSGRLPDLANAGAVLGGRRPAIDVQVDLALQFDALPEVSVAVLFNDADDEFAADCSVLFARRTDRFLDAECIAMLGYQLFRRLKKAVALVAGD